MDASQQQDTRCLIIVNPAAGGGRAGRAWPDLARKMTAAGLRFDTAFTERQGDATAVCREALERGVRRIIVAGGDGTLNEVANGFFDATGTPSPAAAGACLGIMPLGTGSDFARTLGIRAGAKAIPTLCAGVTTLVDVGLVARPLPNGVVEHRIFVNVADAGIGADTARRVNQGRKLFGPTLSYLIRAVQAIADYHPSSATLTIDDQPPIEQRASIIVIANLRYFGGGMLVAPHARSDDGLFDLLWVGAAAKRRLLLDILPRVYAGKHIGHPLVNLRNAARIDITSDPPLPLEVDGEQFGTTPATFTVLPRSLQVIVPARS